MSEIILVFVFVAILFGLQVFTKQIKKPLIHYIKISAALAMLILLWIFGGNGNIPLKVILSVLMVTSLYREYLSIKKLQENN
jgi:hypothetical protein